MGEGATKGRPLIRPRTWALTRPRTWALTLCAQGTEMGREPSMMEIAVSADLVAGAQSETHSLGK